MPKCRLSGTWICTPMLDIILNSSSNAFLSAIWATTTPSGLNDTPTNQTHCACDFELVFILLSLHREFWKSSCKWEGRYAQVCISLSFKISYPAIYYLYALQVSVSTPHLSSEVWCSIKRWIQNQECFNRQSLGKREGNLIRNDLLLETMAAKWQQLSHSSSDRAYVP